MVCFVMMMAFTLFETGVQVFLRGWLLKAQAFGRARAIHLVILVLLTANDLMVAVIRFLSQVFMRARI